MAASTPKMGLYTWNKPLDPYDYVQFTDNWNKVDYHDHTPGRGVQIPMGGIAVGAVGPLQLSFTASQIGVWNSLVPNLSAGVIATTSRYTPSVRLEGNNDVVRFKGAITNNSGASIAAGSTLFTLPSGYYPTATVLVGAIQGGVSVLLTINTNGTVTSNTAWASATNLQLDALTYTLS